MTAFGQRSSHKKRVQPTKTHVVTHPSESGPAAASVSNHAVSTSVTGSNVAYSVSNEDAGAVTLLVPENGDPVPVHRTFLEYHGGTILTNGRGRRRISTSATSTSSDLPAPATRSRGVYSPTSAARHAAGAPDALAQNISNTDNHIRVPFSRDVVVEFVRWVTEFGIRESCSHLDLTTDADLLVNFFALLKLYKCNQLQQGISSSLQQSKVWSRLDARCIPAVLDFAMGLDGKPLMRMCFEAMIDPTRLELFRKSYLDTARTQHQVQARLKVLRKTPRLPRNITGGSRKGKASVFATSRARTLGVPRPVTSSSRGAKGKTFATSRASTLGVPRSRDGPVVFGVRRQPTYA